MTVSKKVLLAAAIVSAGYGLAALLGTTKHTPFAEWRSQGAASGELASIAAPLNENASHRSPAAGTWALSGARLIPDARPGRPGEGHDDEAPFPHAAERSNDSALALTGVAPSPLDEAVTPNPPGQSATRALPGPRAKLRNEAPRALAVEQSSPVMVKSLDPIAPASAGPAQRVQLLSAPTDTTSNSTPTRLAGETSPPAAASASYNAAVGTSGGVNSIAPAPFPPSNDLQEPRTHIVVDGDSLVKLAGRYLDDPHRGEEIFELNRHLLSDPELLPIGAEIVIPPRDRSATGRGEWPQSFLPPGAALHAAARGGLVPVRPIPSSASVMPRAQLSRPLPVE